LANSNEKLGGTHGRILHVDLTEGVFEYETLPSKVVQLLVGGRALIAYFLLRDLPVNVDSLSPENLLIFAPGVLQGTNLPGSGRHSVGGKSPLTGAVGSSEAGGWWGHELKWAGYDALIFHGKSAEPVYLWIHNGKPQLRPAKHLWGKETAEVQNLIREELGDKGVRIAQIGIAGENKVLFSAIMHDVNRAAGRNGLGALMGSKNLKAVAVRGSQRVDVDNKKRIIAVSKWLGSNYKEKVPWAVKMGTPIGVLNLGRLGGLPTRAFQDPLFDGREAISGQRMYETIAQERDTCQVCPISCKQVVKYDGREKPFSIDPVYGGPEYETIAALGSNCGVDDIYYIAKANERCAAYGLDTISTGVVISFVMECVDRGLLSVEDTGGYLPVWGDPKAMLDGIELIARRESFGAKMANGVARLANEIGHGAQEFALHVKGQELPMHEPRLKPGTGLGYAVAPVGADHMMNISDTDYVRPGNALERVNSVYSVEPLPVKDLSEEKLNVFYHEVNWQHFNDCAVICMFYPYHYHHLAEALSGATGIEYSIQDILEIGERAQTLCRLFNYREGFTVKDDKLPERVMKAFQEGPLAGIEITPEVLDWARHRFYELMGWDSVSGKPGLSRVQALGLHEILTDEVLKSL